jgi:hypothetical protein
MELCVTQSHLRYAVHGGALEAAHAAVKANFPRERLIELHPLSRRYCKERRYREENDSSLSRELPCARLG